MPSLEYVAKLRCETALSKYEIEGIIGASNILPPPSYWAYVGNIAIKSHIASKWRGKVDVSTDLDMIVFKNFDAEHMSSFFNVEGREFHSEKAYLLDKVISTLRHDRRHRKVKHSRYVVIQVTTPETSLDVYTYVTGIGPIPINLDDLKAIETMHGLPVMNRGYLLATNLNPQAINKERMNRVAYMFMDHGYSGNDANEFMRKLGDAIKDGKLTPITLQKTINMLRESKHRKIFDDLGIIDTVALVKKQHSKYLHLS